MEHSAAALLDFNGKQSCSIPTIHFNIVLLVEIPHNSFPSYRSSHISGYCRGSIPRPLLRLLDRGF